MFPGRGSPPGFPLCPRLEGKMVRVLRIILRIILKASYKGVTHLWGRISRKYYFEDYVRVYPDGIVFDIFGKKREPSRNDINNFLNHRKFYRFAAQFTKGRRVADIGCGSGYGCDLLEKQGAAFVSGSDISEAAIRYAKERYGGHIEFIVQTAVNLKSYQDNSFDVAISCEVLEHLKEYGKEEHTIREMKRITKDGGIIVIGTANSEMLGDHGFYYDEIENLISNNFSKYVIFENALIPFVGKERWFRREEAGKTGVVVSQKVNLEETVLPDGLHPELKSGLAANSEYEFDGVRIDLNLLHNTHSWIIVARNLEDS